MKLRNRIERIEMKRREQPARQPICEMRVYAPGSRCVEVHPMIFGGAVVYLVDNNLVDEAVYRAIVASDLAVMNQLEEEGVGG